MKLLEISTGCLLIVLIVIFLGPKANFPNPKYSGVPPNYDGHQFHYGHMRRKWPKGFNCFLMTSIDDVISDISGFKSRNFGFQISAGVQLSPSAQLSDPLSGGAIHPGAQQNKFECRAF